MFRKLLNSELGRPDIEEYKALSKSPITVVLDNVRSRHNIGSAFRTCDAFRAVDWVWRQDTVEAVRELKAHGYTVIGVEQTEDSISTDDFLYGRRELDPAGRYAVIFGNEVHGISQEAVDLCDFTLEIPQYGTKHSINVSVAIGIVLYVLGRGLH